MIMHTETTRITQVCYILGRLSIRLRCIKHVKTDALILSVPAKKIATVNAINELRFDQLHRIRSTYELQGDAIQLFLNSHAEVSPLTSEDLVYRFNESGTPLQGKYNPPHCYVHPPTPLTPWKDLTEDQAV